VAIFPPGRASPQPFSRQPGWPIPVRMMEAGPANRGFSKMRPHADTRMFERGPHTLHLAPENHCAYRFISSNMDVIPTSIRLPSLRYESASLILPHYPILLTTLIIPCNSGFGNSFLFPPAGEVVGVFTQPCRCLHLDINIYQQFFWGRLFYFSISTLTVRNPQLSLIDLPTTRRHRQGTYA
jgi:hypothetical protein